MIVIGHRALPEGTPRGGVVVLHEAFGVTPHIVRVAEHYARLGYATLAPNLFAAVGEMEALPQNKFGLDRGRELIGQRTFAEVLAEISECVAELSVFGKVGLVGYCWGGSLAYAGAAKVPGVACASAYYGGRLAELAKAMVPACPTVVHLAELDRYVPLSPAETALRKLAGQGVQTYVYAADHGFNRDDGVTFDRACAALAEARTVALLRRKLDNTLNFMIMHGLAMRAGLR